MQAPPKNRPKTEECPLRAVEQHIPVFSGKRGTRKSKSRLARGGGGDSANVSGGPRDQNRDRRARTEAGHEAGETKKRKGGERPEAERVWGSAESEWDMGATGLGIDTQGPEVGNRCFNIEPKRGERAVVVIRRDLRGSSRGMRESDIEPIKEWSWI
ncbi:hypothetical protein FA13DRAFT_1713721 [Coprinellus micaceus]|uniref:Uncharacterized protein n=1 Tax=Coprinellus micaceus TaxID=71717 RepID=A0A4Y7SVH9_COPMI|nr:hypothetical protein FA13DRAFT_1713721 [Coprinellus micaceus]